jgi:hypothetical protein
VRQVKEFSNAEMNRDSGTIKDDVFEVYLIPMLKEAPKFMWNKQDGRRCVGLKTGEFKRYFMDTLKHVRPNWRHLKNKMLSLGAIEHAFTGGYPGYLFPQFSSIESFNNGVGTIDFDDGGNISDHTGGVPGGF